MTPAILIRPLRSAFVGALSLVLLAAPASALAADLRFTLDTGGDVLSFTLPEQPVPSPGVLTDDYFGFWNLAAVLNGAPVTLELIQFWQGAPARGGFDARVNSSLTFAANGPQLYTGTTSDPTFVTGDFDTASGRLVIDPAQAVPEPGAWALMLVGFGALGYALRRHRPMAA